MQGGRRQEKKENGKMKVKGAGGEGKGVGGM